MSSIEFRNITKVFGHFTACSDVSLSIERGTIHAIIGENGAGKSTLVKLLGGIEDVTSGELFLDNQPYRPQSAQDAFQNKIAFIHQHFVLAAQLTALDNLLLSATANGSCLRPKNHRQVHASAEKLLKRFGWHIPLNQLVCRLSVGEQQRLEIVKALMQHPDIIILDEPTAVLTPQESEDLLKFILQLKSEKKTIILISHKLNEIKNVADCVSVLRQGKLVTSQARSELSIDEMAELMIGRRIVKQNNVKRTFDNTNFIKLDGTSIDLHRSEIFGVAGIEGNGQSQLIANILSQLRTQKIPYGDITEDRIHLSIFDGLDLTEHMLLKYKSVFIKNGFIDKKSLLIETQKLMERWDVRPREPAKNLSEFSGGNQQKFVVGRELWSNPEVLLAAHPTRGVDLGAQDKIHNALLEYSENQKTVILVSSDLDEILFLSDRFIILNKNHIYGPFLKNQLTETEIGLYMAGHAGATA